MVRGGYIYMMTNKNKTTLYIGVTSDLVKRIYEHRNKENPNSFTARYNLDYCVYYEEFADIDTAILREKQLKGWTRKKKDWLINQINPDWKDLSSDL
jgi:Predicted endonuclease containing a URI domain